MNNWFFIICLTLINLILGALVTAFVYQRKLDTERATNAQQLTDTFHQSHLIREGLGD